MRENRELKSKMNELQHSIKVKDDDIEQLKKSHREQNELIKSLIVALSSNSRVFSFIIQKSSNTLKFSPIEEFNGEKIICKSGTNFLAFGTEGSVFCYQGC